MLLSNRMIGPILLSVFSVIILPLSVVKAQNHRPASRPMVVGNQRLPQGVPSPGPEQQAQVANQQPAQLGAVQGQVQSPQIQHVVHNPMGWPVYNPMPYGGAPASMHLPIQPQQPNMAMAQTQNPEVVRQINAFDEARKKQLLMQEFTVLVQKMATTPFAADRTVLYKQLETILEMLNDIDAKHIPDSSEKIAVVLIPEKTFSKWSGSQTVANRPQVSTAGFGGAFGNIPNMMGSLQSLPGLQSHFGQPRMPQFVGGSLGAHLLQPQGVGQFNQFGAAPLGHQFARPFVPMNPMVPGMMYGAPMGHHMPMGYMGRRKKK